MTLTIVSIVEIHIMEQLHVDSFHRPAVRRPPVLSAHGVVAKTFDACSQQDFRLIADSEFSCEALHKCNLSGWVFSFGPEKQLDVYQYHIQNLPFQSRSRCHRIN